MRRTPRSLHWEQQPKWSKAMRWKISRLGQRATFLGFLGFKMRHLICLSLASRLTSHLFPVFFCWSCKTWFAKKSFAVWFKTVADFGKWVKFFHCCNNERLLGTARSVLGNSYLAKIWPLYAFWEFYSDLSPLNQTD